MALTEVEIFHPIVQKGLDDAGYINRMTSYFNKLNCLDEEMLLTFIKESQPDNYQKLQERCDNPDKKIIERVVEEVDSSSVLNVLKREIDIENLSFRTFFQKPEKHAWVTDADKLFSKNIFSYVHELNYYGSEEIDFGIFINGLPIGSMELKYTTAASHYTYRDAITQYQERVKSSKKDNIVNRYLDYKKGALFHIALDEKEAHVCTMLRENNVYFLPFNKGIGKGIEQGAGNEEMGAELPTSYIWNEILKPERLSEIIYDFMFYENQFDDDGNKVGEILIFPRYHQLNVVNKVTAKIVVDKTKNNYLIQHSAGSGKSNSIVWLAHRLSSLHDDAGERIFTSVIIVNDRKVVIKQLQENIKNLDTLVLDELVCITRNKSTRLAQAIDDKKHIIITTLQAFLNVERKLKEDNSDKRFAIIIDESHSSTEGLDIEAVCESLSKGGTSSSKPDNVSFIGFTATPKDTTLAKFGKYIGKNADGKDVYEPFDNYSMKQAIQEGFILDVLASYVEVKAHCDVLKISADDPKVTKKLAKDVLEKFVREEAVSIPDKVQIIMEHFINNVYGKHNGEAKAMIVTDGIAEVIEYDTAIREYIKNSSEDFVKDIKHLVAFSGEKDGKTENDYNQLRPINGEINLERAFNTKEYQILVVANKYQTGYDQPKLVAMYIDKALHDVQAVQTLSRLNRPYHHPNEKSTYILDFVNNYEDIKAAFSRFYQTTTLCTNISKDKLDEAYQDVVSLPVIDLGSISDFSYLVQLENPSIEDKLKMARLVSVCVQRMEELDLSVRKNMLARMSLYFRMFVLLKQITDVSEPEYEDLSQFLENVLNSFSHTRGGNKSLIDGLKKKVLVTTTKITQENVGTDEYSDNGEMVRDIKGKAYSGETTDDEKEYLSVVVDEVNIALGNSGSNENATIIIQKLHNDNGLKVYARLNEYSDYEGKFKRAYIEIITNMLKNHEIDTRSYSEFIKSDRIIRLAKATYNLFK